ncbi:MAG: DUF1801 domain-containing protein [Hyphomicrobiales bacterium]|nr:DUF1801 domain-containing protein [Hyphomicrobiales bacterium]
MVAPEVEAVVGAYPPAARRRFEELRRLVYQVAEREGAGPLTETLKWGEPAYLTAASKAGTTVRLAWKAKEPAVIGAYVNCNTTLVETWRRMFDGTLAFAGNRAVLLDLAGPLPDRPLAICLAQALTYHRDKRRS